MIAGGAERQQWILARSLAKYGHQAVIYTLSDHPRPDKMVDGVIFRWTNLKTPILGWPKILQRERADWWYWRGQDYYLGYLVLLAHIYKTKVVFACAFDADCKPRQALTRRRYLWPAYALGLKTADRILVQHQDQYKLLAKTLQSKARLVLSLSGDSHPIKERDCYVSWVAVLRETKRPHLIVEIAQRLPNVHFIVCGPVSTHRTRHEYADGIVSFLQSCQNIEYRGQVYPDEAQTVIRHSALLLSTSSQEGFPNTFLQAWSEGVPVISLELDPGGVIESFNLGVVSKTIEDCAKDILKLITDEELNNLIGQNCIAYVQQNHSENVVIQQFLDSLT